MRRIPLEGHQFGRLTVLEYVGFIKDKPRYKCRCSCGTELEMNSDNLRTGNSTSCGCARKETTTGANSHLYTGGKQRAEYRRQVKQAAQRNLDFTLTFEQVVDFFGRSCYYCGQEPVADNRGHVRNGIDRRKNAIGYSMDNCVSCCSSCNRMKHAMDDDEFIDWVRRSYEHQQKKVN